MQDNNVPISGPFRIEKALKFVKSSGHNEFQGSSGWIEKFKTSHGTAVKVISGEMTMIVKIGYRRH